MTCAVSRKVCIDVSLLYICLAWRYSGSSWAAQHKHSAALCTQHAGTASLLLLRRNSWIETILRCVLGKGSSTWNFVCCCCWSAQWRNIQVVTDCRHEVHCISTSAHALMARWTPQNHQQRFRNFLLGQEPIMYHKTRTFLTWEFNTSNYEQNQLSVLWRHVSDALGF